MKKRALVAVAEGFEEIEAVTCIDILRRAGVEVVVAGLEKTDVTGSHGIKIAADVSLDSAGSSFDALVLPGGLPGADNLASSDRVKKLIEHFNSSGKIVAAICASPALVLAPAGILEGKKATCYPALKEKLPAGVTYKNEKTVVDSNIITSQGPATAISFALKITESLAGSDVARSLAAALLCWMFGYLLLLFIALPVIELALLLEIGRLIGVMPTVGAVILTGAAGAALARSQGFRVIGRIKYDLSRGVIPGNDMVEGALVLAGGIMLLTPGFITDLAGFSALIPATRSLITGYLRKKIKEKTKTADSDVFEAEVYEIED